MILDDTEVTKSKIGSIVLHWKAMMNEIVSWTSRSGKIVPRSIMVACKFESSAKLYIVIVKIASRDND